MGEVDRRLDQQGVAGGVVEAEDEALVDLQLVGADLLQIGQGRQAGAVVVQGDGDARPGEAAEDAQGDLGIGDHGGLGDLEAQAGAGGLHRLKGEVGEALVRHQAAGDVDRDGQVVTGAAQAGLILYGLADHPFGQGADVAGLLGHADEEVRGDAATARVGPAGQRLYGPDAVGAEVVFRLVVQRELAVVERGHQLADQRQVAGGVAVAGGVEAHGADVGGASLIDGYGGAVDGRGDGAVGQAGAGEAGGEGDVDRGAVQDHGRLGGLALAGGGFDRLLVVGGAKDEAKHAGPDAGHRGAAGQAREAVADGGEKAGHGVVADGVAQHLEAVDAEQDDIDVSLAGGGAFERQAVAEARLLVVQGHVGQARVTVERVRPAGGRRQQRRQIRKRTAHAPGHSRRVMKPG